MEKRTSLTLLTAPLILVSILLAMSACTPPPEPEPEQPQQMGPTTAPIDTTYSWVGFPTTAINPQQAEILVEKIAPASVRPLDPYSYDIIVTNRTDYTVEQVVLTEQIPQQFELIEAQPAPEVRGDTLKWDLGSITPQQRQTITITGKASQPGTLRHIGGTDLNFTFAELTGIANVIEPLIDFRADAPTNVIIADPIPVTLSFQNSGTAPVTNARLVHTLPKNLLTRDGKSKIELDIGNLQPGEVKDKDLELRAEEVGVYQTKFVVTADDGLTASANLKFFVVKPTLQITANAPGKRFVGNIIPYDIELKNVGDAISRDTVVTQTIPEGTSLASTTENGINEGNLITWDIGSLQPGESKKVSSRVVAKQIMTARATASATAIAADPVSTVMITDVAGISGILLEIVDENDPVPLGETEIYTIRVDNTGSLPSTKIVVKCILEEGMEFVKSSGATKSNLEGQVLVFEPFPALDPQNHAVWRVTVRARKAGDVRFTAQIEAEQLERPVTENEATHFYE